MSANIEHLRAVGRAATEGPWEVGEVFWKVGSTRGMPDEWWVTVEAAGQVVATMPKEAAPSAANAEFIATARNEWDGLLDEVEALRAKVARARELLRRLADQIEASGFDPLAILTVTTLTEAERQGYLDGVQTVVTGVTNALDGPDG